MRQLKRIFLTGFVLLIFAAGLWLGFKITRWTKAGSGAREENTTTVIRQVQTLSDFVTVKYVVEKVVILTVPPDSTFGKFFEGENRVLLLAHGIVKAGIDLQRLKPGDVKVSGKKIFLRLPQPQITDAYLDDQKTKVIDWQKGFLRDFDKDLEQTARQNAVDDIRRAAREDGILKEANDRAKLELALFLHQAGFEQVEFVEGTLPTTANPAREDVPQF